MISCKVTSETSTNNFLERGGKCWLSYDHIAITCCMRVRSWLQLWKLIFSDWNTSTIVTFYEIPQRNSNISRRLMALLSWKSIEIKSGEFMIFILLKNYVSYLPLLYTMMIFWCQILKLINHPNWGAQTTSAITFVKTI